MHRFTAQRGPRDQSATRDSDLWKIIDYVRVRENVIRETGRLHSPAEAECKSRGIKDPGAPAVNRSLFDETHNTYIDSAGALMSVEFVISINPFGSGTGYQNRPLHDRGQD